MIIFNDYCNFKLQLFQVYYFSIIKFKCILQFYQAKITNVKMWYNVMQKRVIQTPVTKTIGKTAIWTIFCFCVSLSNYTNWVFIFLIQQSHVQWCVLWYLLCNANKLLLFFLNLRNKDFTWPTQIFKLLVWAAKAVKTYKLLAIKVTQNNQL